MEIDFMLAFLGWCSAINIGMLLFWLCVLFFAPDWLYKMHTRWVTVSEEYYLNTHFLLIGAYKILIIFFNLIPYFALRFMT